MATQQAAPQSAGAPAAHPLVSTERTDVAVVGGGPAGAVLALLLARQGVPVTLLEEHRDFDRDFRGDTIHPSTMEVLREIGLAERLLALPHSEIRQMAAPLPDGGSLVVADFGRLRARYPYVVMMPQVAFLNFLTAEARQYPAG